jgi:multidrug efflux pump subunit AcrA (membrane-fusion protein)
MPDGVQRPPLAVGMFVQAEIYGQTLEDVFVVPRAAVRDRSQVLIVDADDRLHFRDNTVVRFQGDEVVVRDGPRDGERICLSPLSVVTEGMRVRSLEEARPTHREEPGAAPESPPPPPSAGATP